jgi:hypothetical protein
MPQITWTDKINARHQHPDVVRAIEKLALSEPDATYKVHVNALFNPTDPLDWSLIITSPRGRRHLNVEQRQPRGAIKFSYD